MTEYELVDLSMTALAHLSTSGLGFASITFAYLLATFVVGRKLSRGIAICMSGIYTLTLFGPMMGMVGALWRMNWTTSEYLRLYPEGSAFGDGSGVSGVSFVLTLFPFVLGWAASVIYLHAYMRRKPQVTPRPRDQG